MDGGKPSAKPRFKPAPNLLRNTTIIVALGALGNIAALYTSSTVSQHLTLPELVFIAVFIFFGFASFQNALDDMKQGNYFFPVCSLFAWLAFFITAYALIYKDFGLMDGNDPVRRASDFLYFSIITWTTVGYGDLRPAVACRLFAASEALLGYIFMGLYISLFFLALNSYADFLKSSFYGSGKSEKE